MTLRFLPLFAALAVTAVSLSVCAQTPQLSGTTDVGSVEIGPGGTATVRWTLSVQANSLQGNVAPSIQAPTGWNAEGDTATFTLGGPNGQTSREISVRVFLPAEAQNVSRGSLVLRATISIAGQTQDTTEQSVIRSFLAPIPPPPPPPPDYTWAFVGSGAGITTLLLGGYLLQARRVRITVEQPRRRFNVGTGGSYTLVVTNPSRSPQTVELRVTRLPKDWSAAFSFPVVQLRGRERTEVPLWVNVPVDATPNVHESIRVQARPNRFSPWLVSKKLGVDTLDVKVPAASA
jgi:uncharacterized membrane protein